ncbi:MAG: hypothetical protein QOJ63_605 [Solirubrobacteraceae bacterium]|nr:hypothetical protein [Solirubrobacteraceae bacterium]
MDGRRRIHDRARGPAAFDPAAEGYGTAMHILVLAPDPVDADTLRGVVGDELDDARVLVVSPALNESPLAFWMSDADEAIADAKESGTQTAGDLRADGVAANSTTGEGEPLTAQQDALATFPADRIVIFVREADDQRYREDDVCTEAQRRFDVPVTLTTL